MVSAGLLVMVVLVRIDCVEGTCGRVPDYMVVMMQVVGR